MDQAYELKALVEKLKDQGLEVAESAAKAVAVGVIDWLDESALKSATPLDDIARVLYPQLKKSLLDLADKIDGQVG
jgi:hypothetical protein